jgi:hypothetical protein
MPTIVDAKVFPKRIVDAIEFTLVCFWIELQQFLIRQKYYSLESLYLFCSFACSVLSLSGEYIFPILFAFGCL